jgi:hypothetical protein
MSYENDVWRKGRLGKGRLRESRLEKNFWRIGRWRKGISVIGGAYTRA